MGQNHHELENLKMGIGRTIQYKILALYRLIYRCCYRLACMGKPVKSNKVVIPLYRQDELEGNLKAVYEEMKKTHPELQFHIIKPNNKISVKLFKEINMIADAKIILLDDYYLPVYLINPRKETDIVQLWHAAGAFKKFGYSTVNTKFGPSSSYLDVVPIHSHYTHVFVSSENMIPYYAEAFHMQRDRIYPVGVPRIDYFSDQAFVEKTRDQILKTLSEKQRGMVKILIAPTYRAGSSSKESDLDIVEELIKTAGHLDKDKLIVFVGHPYIDHSHFEALQKTSNIIVDGQFSTNDWMLVADAFITDYSSAIFEFALFHKPLAHYVPDLEAYTKNRGLYNDLHNISDGAILRSRSALIDWINSRHTGESYDTSRMVEYNFSQTSHIAKSIVEQLFK